MFKAKKSPSPTNYTISSNIKITGDIEFSEHIIFSGFIQGIVHGAKNGASHFETTTGSQIIGDIIADDISIHGKVEGNVFARKKLTLAGTCNIRGNIEYAEINMEKGAIINGQIKHNSYPSQDANKKPSVSSKKIPE